MAHGDQPVMKQIREMIGFCGMHDPVYIFGAGHNQLMLGKYLEMCGILVRGYIDDEMAEDGRDVIPTADISAMISTEKNAGILLATSDWHANEHLRTLTKNGVDMDQIYILSEFNKRTISHKMTPRPRERMWIEVNLADHCNLNCQMCDHFAPMAEHTFMNMETFKRDMERLAELTDHHIGIMKLQGGEPLLNDDLIEYIRITRELFPDTVIFLFTAGILLKAWEHHKNGNLWQACHDHDVTVELTVYPIGLNVEEIKALAKKYDVKLDTFTAVGDRSDTSVKKSAKHPFLLEKNAEKWEFIGCYQFNESIVLKEGKLYTCPMIPYIDHFNRYFKQSLTVGENDYIDIYKVKDYSELAEYMAKRTGFCDYCDVKNRRLFEWKQSERALAEYVDIHGSDDGDRPWLRIIPR